MSSAETPAPSFLQPLVGQRRQVAVGLAVAAAVLAALAVWWGVWGFNRAASRPAPADPKVSLEELGKQAQPADEARPPRSPDYQVAAVWAGALALLTLLSAGWVYTHPPDPAAPVTAARTEVVFFGGLVGLLTALFGAALGYRWYRSAVEWIASKDPAEAKWVLYAAAVFLAGLLVMFVSLQLARTEERSNATLRRVLYGFNAVFMGLLLLLVLVVVNVFVSVRVPGTLATNESAFHGLSDEAKRFLHKLDQPVHVYLLLPERHSVPVGRNLSYDTLYADCRGLLTACEDESPNFRATLLSPAFDAARIHALLDRLQLQKSGESAPLGMLVTVGSDETAHAFIPERSLWTVERGQLVFQAENRMLTEVLYLTDPGRAQKVYFTQGHKELALDRPGERSMSNLIQYLRERKFTVEPLTFEGPDPKVPDDAAVVVVPGLRQFVGPEDPMRAALLAYARRPDRPGKLFLFLPAFGDKDGKVSATGLEPLLSELGVQPDAGHRLLSVPGRTEEGIPPEVVEAQTARLSDLDLLQVVRPVKLMVTDVRPIQAATDPAGQGRTTTLFESSVPTWQAPEYDRPALGLWLRLRPDRNRDVWPQIRLTTQPVPFAVAVTDTTGAGDKRVRKSRALVFGTDVLLEDDPPNVRGSDQYKRLLLSDGIDWLREREASFGISPHKVAEFSIDKPIEWSSQAVLMLLITIGITVLGLGVWLSRRR